MKAHACRVKAQEGEKKAHSSTCKQIKAHVYQNHKSTLDKKHPKAHEGIKKHTKSYEKAH